jgi:hypothetical protein
VHRQVWVTDLSKTAICLDEKVQVDIPAKVALGNERPTPSHAAVSLSLACPTLPTQLTRPSLAAVIGREADGCSQEMLAAADKRSVCACVSCVVCRVSCVVCRVPCAVWFLSREFHHRSQGVPADVRLLRFIQPQRGDGPPPTEVRTARARAAFIIARSARTAPHTRVAVKLLKTSNTGRDRLFLVCPQARGDLPEEEKHQLRLKWYTQLGTLPPPTPTPHE